MERSKPRYNSIIRPAALLFRTVLGILHRFSEIRYTTPTMRRKRQRVLVVYKRSAYQLHLLQRHDPRLLQLLRRGHPDVVDMRRGHEVHQHALETVIRILQQRSDVKVDVVYRADLRATSRYDFVIAVGGDGTFLQASHLLGETPILGVNSDVQRSEAVFCGATRDNFSRLLKQALTGTLSILPIHRLRVVLNRRSFGPLVLNDVLIAHHDPATMSRYRLQIGAVKEDQKSSGLWIATAAGSSSAIRAAGGRELPWSSKRFQYRPRELYLGRLSRYRLTGGSVSPSTAVRVTWLMRDGRLFIDGPHVHQALQFGDRIEVRLADEHPLHVLGLGERRTG